MNQALSDAINGSAAEMAEYIKSNNVDIDVSVLEELDGQIRGVNSAKRDEFLAEAKRVRQLLRKNGE